jgi:transcription elongation factor Elf1
MPPKRTCKLVHETTVEEPTQDLNVPSETLKEEEEKVLEEQKDRDNHDDHEIEKE